jgi:hypothetical protein
MTAQPEATVLPEHDATAHAGQQIFGVSDELDPSDNDLVLYTLSRPSCLTEIGFIPNG